MQTASATVIDLDAYRSRRSASQATSATAMATQFQQWPVAWVPFVVFTPFFLVQPHSGAAAG